MTSPAVTHPIDIGAPGPDFRLRGTSGDLYTLEDFREARLLVLVFISNGCPAVRAYEERLDALAQTFAPVGVQLVAVNSNDPYLSPGDALSEMVSRATSSRFAFPYLKDDDGDVARAYGATNTPHAFLLDASRTLRYRGRIDDARNPENVTSHDLETAIRQLLSGETPSVSTTEPFGCSIVR